MSHAHVLPDGHACRQGHDFLGDHHDRNARKTWAVVWLTSVMMVVEIAAGLVFHSMALLADGIHMATHAGAMLIAAGAYMLARRRLHDRRRVSSVFVVLAKPRFVM